MIYDDDGASRLDVNVRAAQKHKRRHRHRSVYARALTAATLALRYLWTATNPSSSFFFTAMLYSKRVKVCRASPLSNGCNAHHRTVTVA